MRSIAPNVWREERADNGKTRRARLAQNHRLCVPALKGVGERSEDQPPAQKEESIKFHEFQFYDVVRSCVCVWYDLAGRCFPGLLN